jgi:hypothetical protein
MMQNYNMNIEDFKTYISSLGNAFRVSKGTALNKRKINLIQKRMDFKFPQDYIDFLNCFGSLHIEVCEDVWPRIKNLDAAPYWIYQYGVIAMGISENITDNLNVEKIYYHFQNKYNPEIKIVPVFKQIMITEYYYCLDESGAVYFWAFDEPWPKRILDNFFKRFYTYIEELKGNKDYIVNNKEEIYGYFKQS